MRYIVAMIFAAAAAALTMLYVAGPVASWSALKMSFESPDQNDNWYDAIYMATNVAALIIGWLAGWVIGGPLRSGPRPG